MNSNLFGSRGSCNCSSYPAVNFQGNFQSSIYPDNLPNSSYPYPGYNRNFYPTKGYNLSNGYAYNSYNLARGYNLNNGYNRGYSISNAYPHCPAALQPVSPVPLQPLSPVPSCPYQVIAPLQPPAHLYYDPNFSWREPEVVIPSRGVERILIAILILVVLDILFLRPRR